MSVVHVANSTYSKYPHFMYIIRVLVFLAAYFNFWFRAEHIKGKCNDLADALSHNNLDYFLSQSESSSDHSPDIPVCLMALLGEIQDWTSPHWIALFRASLSHLRVLPSSTLVKSVISFSDSTILIQIIISFIYLTSSCWPTSVFMRLC